MLLPFACPRCKADKWLIRYDSEEKTHQIECAGCGYEQVLEDIFKPKRNLNVKKQRKENRIESI
jgi:Zn ribbon nucleic-acid-binding protein